VIPFEELPVGARFAIPGASAVYQKTGPRRGLLISISTHEPAGRPTHHIETGSVVPMGPRAWHYDRGGLHQHPDNRPEVLS